MTYHADLIKDKKRVNLFKKAIKEKVHGITYDLGTGSGILAKFASEYAEEVHAYEINPITIRQITHENLKENPKIQLYNIDASTHKFTKQPDVVICEMLDTALIDEEQVPVINNVLKYTKPDTIFIPESTTDTIQLIKTTTPHITYHENNQPPYQEYSEEQTYNKTSFSTKINPNFKKNIIIQATKNGTINAIKLTTYTQLTQNIKTGPTPMLNPPLLVPIKETKIKKGEKINLNLQYQMGGGLNTIKTNTS